MKIEFEPGGRVRCLRQRLCIALVLTISACGRGGDNGGQPSPNLDLRAESVVCPV